LKLKTQNTKQVATRSSNKLTICSGFNGRLAVSCKLQQNANESCNSCASLAGLVFACFTVVVMGFNSGHGANCLHIDRQFITLTPASLTPTINCNFQTAAGTVRLLAPPGGIVIRQVCLFVCLFVTLVIISRKVGLEVRFSDEIWHVCSASPPNFTIKFSEFKVNVQGENRHMKIFKS